MCTQSHLSRVQFWLNKSSQEPGHEDDAAQSAHAPAEAEPAVHLNKEPLDETQPVVQSPPEDRISRPVRLELERIPCEKEAKRRCRRVHARSPNRAPRE